MNKRKILSKKTR